MKTNYRVKQSLQDATDDRESCTYIVSLAGYDAIAGYESLSRSASGRIRKGIADALGIAEKDLSRSIAAYVSNTKLDFKAEESFLKAQAKQEERLIERRKFEKENKDRSDEMLADFLAALACNPLTALTEEQAIALVVAISCGKIRNVQITY
jgi:uncharacterized protein YqfA (UPF0365 family)